MALLEALAAAAAAAAALGRGGKTRSHFNKLERHPVRHELRQLVSTARWWGLQALLADARR